MGEDLRGFERTQEDIRGWERMREDAGGCGRMLRADARRTGAGGWMGMDGDGWGLCFLVGLWGELGEGDF